MYFWCTTDCTVYGIYGAAVITDLDPWEIALQVLTQAPDAVVTPVAALRT